MKAPKILIALCFLISALAHAHIVQPAQSVSIEAMADSMQEYIDLRSMIEREQKHQVPSVNLVPLKMQFKEKALQVKDYAHNCSELSADSRKNILEAIQEDERYYPQ